MNDGDFWNDQESAQKTIAEFKIIKAQTDGLTAVMADFEDAQLGYELAREESDDELLEEADEKLFTLAGRMDKNLPAYGELLAYLKQTCDQPVGAMKQAQLAFEEDRLTAAERWIARAAAWDPLTG